MLGPAPPLLLALRLGAIVVVVVVAMLLRAAGLLVFAELAAERPAAVVAPEVDVAPAACET